MRTEFSKYLRSEFDAFLSEELPTFTPFHPKVAPPGFYSRAWRCSDNLFWFVNLVIGRNNLFGVHLFFSREEKLPSLLEPRHPARCPAEGGFAIPLMLFDVPKEEVLNRGMWDLETPKEENFLAVYPSIEECHERLVSACTDFRLRFHKFGVQYMVERTEALECFPNWAEVLSGESLESYRGRTYGESLWFNGQLKSLPVYPSR
jgi:hypothetical protein